MNKYLITCHCHTIVYCSRKGSCTCSQLEVMKADDALVNEQKGPTYVKTMTFTVTTLCQLLLLHLPSFPTHILVSVRVSACTLPPLCVSKPSISTCAIPSSCPILMYTQGSIYWGEGGRGEASPQTLQLPPSPQFFPNCKNGIENAVTCQQKLMKLSLDRGTWETLPGILPTLPSRSPSPSLTLLGLLYGKVALERSFSSVKLVKTKRCSRLGDETLEHTMHICIEGPDYLSDNMLEAVVDNYSEVNKRRLPL